ncbi:MAG: hypothetical protein H6733_07005 [Alphaproteobacteria bacterium]|nr:hypothetical protein [Alphaproteobacteria bacterium]
MSCRSPSLLLLASLAACTAGTDDAAVDSDSDALDVCAAQGLDTVAFDASATGTRLGEVAGDFTAPTTDGTLTLSEAWTGCTSFVFFVHFPGVSDTLMGTAMDGLFEDGPENVHYVFLSDEEDRDARNAVIDDLVANMKDSLNNAVRGKDAKAAWRERFHFVTQRASNVDGSVGAFIAHMAELSSDPSARVDLGDRGMAPVPLPEVFGIDRDQRFDAGGTLSPYVGSPRDELSMGAYLPQFYNYRHDLDVRMDDTSGVTVVPLVDAVSTDRLFHVDAALPDAATMAGFDHLEVDLTVDCTAENPFACSEWDRIGTVWWCADGEACTDRRELARWITPYWRRGRQRYALDASPMLPILAAGGSQHVFLELGPGWERATEWHVAASLRLSDTGGPRPVALVPAFTGGNFDASYNTRDPIAFTPPAGTTHAELVTLISGHGQADGNNCAEWCDHRHTFSVDGTDLATIQHDGASIGSGLGCADQAAHGAIPGQWGNWAPTRAYWCPGLAVQPQRIDITSQVTAGAESTLGYRGTFGTGEPAGGNIDLSSYVVFYADR